MADMSRASSFLPTIKCSMCHRDIEISLLGDHVCGVSGEPTPPPESNGNFSRNQYEQDSMSGSSYLKTGRAMPPRVDTSAANRPFFRQEQLTPVSASPSRSVSPMDGRSPYGKPLRSGPGPLRENLPSPDELSSNLDSAFPVFPTRSVMQNRSQQGGYGGFGNKYAEADPRYAPMSPRGFANGGLLQRMNTIAPGPFDINNRRQGSDANPARNHRRKGTAGSLADMTMSTATQEVGASIPRPSTAGPGHSRTSTTSSGGSRSGIVAPRVPTKNGYGGFGPPSSDELPQPTLLSPENRSQTYPLRNDGQGPSLRRPSDSGLRPQMRRPSNEFGERGSMDKGRSVSGSPPRQRKLSSSGPDLTRPLPPRGGSLIRPRVDGRFGDAPPVPTNINLAAEFGIGNPYHTPSESQSSDASGYSEQSKASSASSPPRSTNLGQSRRRPSDINKMDVLMANLESSMADLKPKEVTPEASPQKNTGRQPRDVPGRRQDPYFLSKASPTDPSIQGGRSLPPFRPDIQEKPVRRPTTAKGDCKGCGEPIKGKSISSADGRLTGRYHKQCFVCKTCSAPFQTSTFYVINNSPYCEHHYHELNGSLCTTCDRGIEGQYLESERKQKFHPACLTCADCRRTLRNDYFEMNGLVYCERDAFRRAQQTRFLGPGSGASNRMERRTTRLMMM